MPRKTAKIRQDSLGRRRPTFAINAPLAAMIEEMLAEQKHTGFRFRGISELCRQALCFYYRHGPWKVQS